MLIQGQVFKFGTSVAFHEVLRDTDTALKFRTVLETPGWLVTEPEIDVLDTWKKGKRFISTLSSSYLFHGLLQNLPGPTPKKPSMVNVTIILFLMGLK